MKLSYNQDTKSFSVDPNQDKIAKAKDEVTKILDQIKSHKEKIKAEHDKLKDLNGTEKQIQELKVKSLLEDEEILSAKLRLAQIKVKSETKKFQLANQIKQLKDKK